jgi:hypothetical protein
MQNSIKINKPMGSQTKRYVWNEVKNKGEVFDLKGTLVKRKKPQVSKTIEGTLWGSFCEKGENSYKSSNRKITPNKNREGQEMKNVFDWSNKKVKLLFYKNIYKEKQ